MLLSSLRAQARRHNPAHTILRQTARCAHQLRSSSSSSSRSHRACVRHAAQTRCVSPSFFFSLSRGFAGGGGAANSPNPNLKGYAVSQASPSSDIILENSQGLRSGVLEVREDPIDEVLEGVRRRLRNRIDKEILEMADIESISDDQGYAEFVNEIGLRLLPVTPYGWLYGRYQVYTYNVTISFSMEYDGKAMNIGDHQLALLENPDRAIGPDTMSTHDHSFVVDISEMDKTGQAMRVNCMSDPQGYLVLKDFEILSQANKDRQSVKAFTQNLEDENMPASQSEQLMARFNPNLIDFSDIDGKMEERVLEFLSALKIDNRMASFVQMHAQRMDSMSFQKNLTDLREFIKP